MPPSAPASNRSGCAATLLTSAAILAIVAAGLVVYPSATHVIVVVLAIAIAVDRGARDAGDGAQRDPLVIGAASVFPAVAIGMIAWATTRGHLVAGDAVDDRVVWGATSLGIPFVFWAGLAIARAFGAHRDLAIVRPFTALSITLLAAMTAAAAHRAASRPGLDRLLSPPSAHPIGDFTSPPVCGDERSPAEPAPRPAGGRASPALEAMIDCVARTDCDPGQEHPVAPATGADPKTFPLESCASLLFARLSPDVVVLREAWQKPLFRNVLGTRQERSHVFHRRGAQWVVTDDAIHVARLASVPFPWIATGAAGIAFAALCWLMGSRTRASSKVRYEAWALAIALLTGAPLAGAALAGLVP